MTDETRRAPRRRVLKSGSITFGGSAIDCVLRNVSKTGAALEVTSPIGIPDQFVLVVPADDSRHRCSVRSVVSEATGSAVLAVPMMGGSLPIDMFADVLKVPLIIVPTVNHDDNQHAKDENIRVQNIYDGIEVFAALMTRLGPAWSGVVP